jgi:hypothetical protein
MVQPRPQDFVVAQSQTEERPAGLLALPEVFGEYPCELFEPKKLDLYDSPSKQQPPIAVIERLNPPQPPAQPDCDLPRVVVRRMNETQAETLPMDESGYEYVKAVVFEQSGDWFRIALPRGSAWIERPNSDGFFAYPEHMTQEALLTYLRPGWDGNIWTSPGVGTPLAAPAAWRAHKDEEIPVVVTSTQTVRGEKWVRVRFATEVCGKVLGNLPSLEAWLPAYRPPRTTSVWFYSRGC